MYRSLPGMNSEGDGGGGSAKAFDVAAPAAAAYRALVTMTLVALIISYTSLFRYNTLKVHRNV